MPEPTTEDLVLDLGMDAEEEQWAEEFYEAIQDMSDGSERSQQAAEFRIGVSDLGFCSERLKRTLQRETPERTDMLLAWLGTAIGDHAEQAITARFPDMIRQAEITVDITVDGRDFRIPGHPDLLDPVHGILWDAKTDFGLDTIMRTGPTRYHRFQRNLYAKGAHAAGLFPNHKLEDIKVGNFYIDRGGVDKRLHVDLEPYDPEIVREAEEWLGEVIYAYTQSAAGHPTEARKEPPREMCAVVCGFYKTCREGDTDVEGLLTEDTVIEAVKMYAEGRDMASRGKRLQEQAKVHLEGISGATGTGPGDHILRWNWRNPSEYMVNRKGGYSIDLKTIKPNKKRK